MSDKWDHILHILERENRDFREAMRAQVGITFLHTINLSRMEILKVFTGAGIIAQYTARKEPNFKLCLFLSIINFCKGLTPCYILSI